MAPWKSGCTSHAQVPGLNLSTIKKEGQKEGGRYGEREKGREKGRRDGGTEEGIEGNVFRVRRSRMN